MFHFESEEYNAYWKDRELRRLTRKEGYYMVNYQGRMMVACFKKGAWYFDDDTISSPVQDDTLREINESMLASDSIPAYHGEVEGTSQQIQPTRHRQINYALPKGKGRRQSLFIRLVAAFSKWLSS